MNGVMRDVTPSPPGAAAAAVGGVGSARGLRTQPFVDLRSTAFSRVSFLSRLCRVCRILFLRKFSLSMQ